MKNAGRITVFGSSKASPTEEAYRQALRLGRLLAEAGYVVYSGGYGGAGILLWESPTLGRATPAWR